MTPSILFSLQVGALTGGASVVAQGPIGLSIPSAVIPVLSMMVAAAVSYGMLKAHVGSLEKEMAGLQYDVARVHDLLRMTSEKVARIEGKLEP